MTRNKKKAKNQASIKGMLLEMVVASLHDAPNVDVRRNVRLPTLRNPSRTREIDVLISGLFAGYPVRIAIECKNHKSVLDVEYIDAFVGKLQDIGIPTQHGILVSPKGFTKGALERSEEVGIRPLMLAGLSPDRLSERIYKAIQSVVYLLFEITNLSVACNIPKMENSFQLWFLYDREAKVQGSIPDLMWKKWVEGQLPSKLGEYDIEIDIPEELQLYVDGRFEPVINAKAKIKVIGLLLTTQGKATQHTLIDPINQQVDRFKTQASFDTFQEKYPLNLFTSEDDLRNFIEQQPEAIKLTIGRFRLPRIRFYSLYWPLSARAVNDFVALAIRCQAEGRIASEKELLQIEGSDLKTIWDPIWSENPLVQKMMSSKLHKE